MAVLPILLVSLAYSQDAPTSKEPVKIPVISGELGECSADLRVTDVKDKPISNAKISLEIKYGFGGFHRSTLEIYTNVDGKARFEGLPQKSRGPLAFVASFAGRTTTVIVEPRDNCHGSYTAILPNEPPPVEKEEE
jgi:hypothetical protein